jgi:hypothetical protein
MHALSKRLMNVQPPTLKALDWEMAGEMKCVGVGRRNAPQM